jgi:hypothetical protein
MVLYLRVMQVCNQKSNKNYYSHPNFLVLITTIVSDI